MENWIFSPTYTWDKLKVENPGEKAAVDQELQITHQNLKNLVENTNFKIKVEGTQHKLIFQENKYLNLHWQDVKILNHPTSSMWNFNKVLKRNAIFTIQFGNIPS